MLPRHIAVRIAVVWLAGVPGSGAAQKLELLGPSGAVPPEGFQLALRAVGPDGRSVPLGDPKVTATGAQVQKLEVPPPLQTWLVVPAPGARAVTVRAKDHGQSVEARYELGPPAAKIALELDPPMPVKQVHKEARLSIRMLRPDGSVDTESAPPVLRWNRNGAEITDLKQTGPGSYEARYILPTTRFPEVGVIVALSAWPHPQSVHGAIGVLRVPMPSQIDLPGKTEPNAEFSIVIAGQRFPPKGGVRAGPDGRFKVPVVVPPGHNEGIGTTVDRVGNRRSARMNLMVPETDQLACVVSPSRLPADGVSSARILCAVSDPFGREASAKDVEMSARRGTLGGRRLVEGGLQERIYTAPRVLSSEPDVIAMRWGRRGSKDEIPIELTQGPAAKVQASSEEVVHRGGALAIQVKVTDAFDRPRPQATVIAPSAVGGTFAPFVPGEGGTYIGRWVPPRDGPDESELTVRAFGPAGSDPARILVWAEARTVFAAVTDVADLPVPGQRLVLGDRTLVTGDDGTVELGALADGRYEIRHGDWRGLLATFYVLDGGALVFPSHAKRRGSQRWRVKIAPETPVNVRVEVAGSTVTYWAETPGGEPIPGRDLDVQISGGERSAPVERNGRRTITVRASMPVTVSIADRETGVTALAEVKP